MQGLGEISVLCEQMRRDREVGWEGGDKAGIFPGSSPLHLAPQETQWPRSGVSDRSLMRQARLIPHSQFNPNLYNPVPLFGI